VNKLQDVKLWSTDITNDQAMALFTAMSENSQLKVLHLSDNNLASVDPELLARVVARLEDVNLKNTNLTNEQIQALFTALSQKSQLKTLDLVSNNLSSLEPALFASVVTSFKEVNLTYTSITNDQVKELFTAMCQNSQLKKLHLRYSNVTSVDPDILATAVSKLEHFCN